MPLHTTSTSSTASRQTCGWCRVLRGAGSGCVGPSHCSFGPRTGQAASSSGGPNSCSAARKTAATRANRHGASVCCCGGCRRSPLSVPQAIQATAQSLSCTPRKQGAGRYRFSSSQAYFIAQPCSARCSIAEPGPTHPSPVLQFQARCTFDCAGKCIPLHPAVESGWRSSLYSPYMSRAWQDLQAAEVALLRAISAAPPARFPRATWRPSPNQRCVDMS